MNLDHLIASNRVWAQQQIGANPAFFEELRRLHAPKYLWIGCSDARVPATQIVDMTPGEMFVHRNVANQVIHTDINCLSVLQYGIEQLGIKDIIVCGHYGCGGIRGAMSNQPLGLIDNWLRHICDTIHKHRDELAAITDPQAYEDRVCELNVIEQVHNVSHTTVVQDAWARGVEVTIHGWIYGVHDGLIKDLHITTCMSQTNAVYHIAK